MLTAEAGIDAAVGRQVDTTVEVERSRAKRLGVFGWFSVAWLAVVALMCIAPRVFPVPELTERSRDAIVSDRFGPQGGHWLGLDSLGYDMLTKVVHGARASMLVSVGAAVFGLVVGGGLGLVAGYVRGWVDSVITSAFNVMLAIPALVLALTLVTVFASGEDVSDTRRMMVVTLGIGVVGIPILGRITRASTLTWSAREFVLAAQATGATRLRIMIKEVLPNVLPAMLSITLLGVSVNIVVEGALALLGLSVAPNIDTPTWGNVIATNTSGVLAGEPWGLVAPSVALFLTILSLNYLGDVVRARFDVRESLL